MSSKTDKTTEDASQCTDGEDSNTIVSTLIAPSFATMWSQPTHTTAHTPVDQSAHTTAHTPVDQPTDQSVHTPADQPAHPQTEPIVDMLNIIIANLCGNTEEMSVHSTMTIGSLTRLISQDTEYGRCDLLTETAHFNDPSATLESLGITNGTTITCCAQVVTDQSERLLPFPDNRVHGDDTIILRALNALATALMNHDSENPLEQVYKKSDIPRLITRMTNHGWTLHFNHDSIDVDEGMECNSSGTTWDNYGHLECFRFANSNGTGIYLIVVHYEFGSPYGQSHEYNVVRVMVKDQGPESLQDIVDQFAQEYKSTLTIDFIPKVPIAPTWEPTLHEQLLCDKGEEFSDVWDPDLLREFQMYRDVFGLDVVRSLIDRLQYNQQLPYGLDIF